MCFKPNSVADLHDVAGSGSSDPVTTATCPCHSHPDHSPTGEGAPHRGLAVDGTILAIMLLGQDLTARAPCRRCRSEPHRWTSVCGRMVDVFVGSCGRGVGISRFGWLHNHAQPCFSSACFCFHQPGPHLKTWDLLANFVLSTAPLRRAPLTTLVRSLAPDVRQPSELLPASIRKASASRAVSPLSR